MTAFGHLITEDVRAIVATTRELGDRFDQNVRIGQAKYHLANAADALRFDNPAHAAREISAAMAALGE